MNLKLSSGKEIVLDDTVKSPKAAAIQWLQERRSSMKPPIEQMSEQQCYDELDRLFRYRKTHGRGSNPDAAQARRYCKVLRAKVKKRLRQLEARLTRPDDERVYGPGAAAWQRAGGAP